MKAYPARQYSPGIILFPGNDHPADPVTARTVIFRKTVHGDEQHIVGQRSDRRMRCTIVETFVINFIGKHDQLVFTSQIDNFFQQFIRIQGTCRIIRVDDDNRLRMRGDLRLDTARSGIQSFSSLHK